MVRQHRVFLIVVALVAASLAPWGPSAQEPVNERAIAQLLLAEDAKERLQGVAVARALGPAQTGPELRTALITALERENAVSRARAGAARRGEHLENRNDEIYFEVAEVVVALRDPRAIPALAGALGTGMMVINALVAFGEQAVPAVLAVTASPDSEWSAVGGGLWTLKLMVEGAAARPLSQPTLQQVRRVARQRLTGQQFVAILYHAIELAAVLGDADLRQVVERLEGDPSEAVARGIADSDDIEQLQRRAAAALARWGAPSPVKR